MTGADATPHSRMVSSDALDRLGRVIDRLSRAKTEDEVYDIILRAGLPDVGARSAAIFLVDAEARELFVGAHDRVPKSTLAYFPISLDLTIPASDAVTSRSPIWIDNRAQRDRWFPLVREAPTTFASSGWIPIELDGEVIGVLGLGFEGNHLFAEIERAYCTMLAGLCAIALARFRAVPPA